MFSARPARETRLKYCETGSRSKRKSGEPAKSLVRRIARESQRPCLTEFPGRCRQRLRDFSLRARLRESVLTGRTPPGSSPKCRKKRPSSRQRSKVGASGESKKKW